jgi:TPR repeat protein
MFNLGVLLADRVDPPELDLARGWYQKAAEAGHTGAMVNLGVLLADRVDPPELDLARGWYQKAAEAGHIRAMFGLGVLLEERVDPPELDLARVWYQKAAEAGHIRAMFGLGVLLAERVDPPELDLARGWLEKAAEAGHSRAMFGLGVLLAERVDPPELDQARGWYQKAAEAGQTDAAYFLGVLYAAQGDADGASHAWRKVIEENQQDDLVISAALALAAVSALKAEYHFAQELLEIAGTRGWTSAGTCVAAFDPNSGVRADARRHLHDLAGDTDALNFLGIASYIDREYDQARSYWTRSSDLHDKVAPLLLHLTAKPQPPAGAKPAERGKPSAPPSRP